MSKISLIIQARLGSHRFRRKVLSKIKDKTMIEHVIERVKLAKNVDQIILCTTKNSEDKILLGIAKKLKIFSFAGDENDVVSRYFHSAKKFNADPIIRITGDCPLIDPNLITKMLQIFFSKKVDYLSNTIIPTFPNGLDVEIFTFNTIEKIYQNAYLKSDKEHVTSYIKNHPQEFKIYNYKNNIDLSDLRLTVDEKEDLKLIRKIFTLNDDKSKLLLKDILKIISKNPEISKINSKYTRNKGYLDSLKKD